MIADRAAFIRAQTRLRPVPLRPDIVLYTADEATELWQKTEDELGQLNLPPPFWAFPWAGGQALARYIAEHSDLVAGRNVLDVASGSGLVAIAAAKAGAARVEANDIDAMACAAMRLNAAESEVALAIHEGDMVGTDQGWDVVFAGDVSYQRDMAERVMSWLEALAARGARVLIGDPGRAYLKREGLVALAGYDVPVPRTLEDADVRLGTVWEITRPA